MALPRNAYIHFTKQQESVYCDRIAVPNFHLKSPKRTKIVFQVLFAGTRANGERQMQKKEEEGKNVFVSQLIT